MIAPQSDVILLKCPLNLSNEHQITFSNETNQYNYFIGLPKIPMDSFTYVRADDYISVPYEYDDIINYNYVMYRNEGFSNKWFYAYIERIEYDSHNSSRVYIKTDVYQTWQFDLTFKQCFVEREHVKDDTVGAHTVDEGIEGGDYIVNHIDVDSSLQDCGIVLASAKDPRSGNVVNGMYNGVPSGVGYFGYRFTELSVLQDDLQELTDDGALDGITSLFVSPTRLMNQTFNGGKITDDNDVRTYDITLTPQNTLNGYTPKNKKMLCYPFSYTIAYNGNGGTKILKPELWNAFNTRIWQVNMALTPGCSIIGYPATYDGGSSYNVLHGLPLGKLPILNFATDLFTNWSIENNVNQVLGYQQGILGMISGAFNLAGGNTSGSGEVISGSNQILSTIYDRFLAERVPPQISGNTNCGDVNFSTRDTTFTFHNMTIRAERARIIDDFFTMYGYKVNSLKIPNLTGRSNWNYVKTVGCNIVANIPQNDLLEIKSLFDNGITLWHNASNFLNYSANNSII